MILMRLSATRGSTIIGIPQKVPLGIAPNISIAMRSARLSCGFSLLTSRLPRRCGLAVRVAVARH